MKKIILIGGNVFKQASKVNNVKNKTSMNLLYFKLQYESQCAIAAVFIIWC